MTIETSLIFVMRTASLVQDNPNMTNCTEVCVDTVKASTGGSLHNLVTGGQTAICIHAAAIVPISAKHSFV